MPYSSPRMLVVAVPLMLAWMAWTASARSQSTPAAPEARAAYREVVGATPIPDGPGGATRDHAVARVWHDPSGVMDEAQLRAVAALHDAAMAGPNVVQIRGDGGDFSTRGSGFNIVFNVDLTNAPPGISSAFTGAFLILRDAISTPVTLQFDVSFSTTQTTSSYVLGSMVVEDVAYAASRAALVASMDDDDFIQNYLPTSLSARFDAQSQTATSVPTLDWPLPLSHAVVSPVSGAMGSMVFANNATYTWHLDQNSAIPSNTHSLLDHVVHAVLAQMGFSSGVTSPAPALRLLPQDLFRFQRAIMDFGDPTPSTAPTTLQQFSTMPREAEFGEVQDFNMIRGHARMGNGATSLAGLFKSSGFVTTTNPPGGVAVMVSPLGPGLRHYPDSLKEYDKVVLDALGWSIAGSGMFSFARELGADWNKDGFTDVLFDEKTPTLPPGRVASVHFGGAFYRGWAPRLSAQPGWERVAINADLNGDAYPDMLWRNTANPTQLAYWFMDPNNPAQILSWGYLPALPSADFEVQTAGDLNFDGFADLLIRNPQTGYNAVWYMSNTGYLAWARLPSVVGPSLRMVGVDFFDSIVQDAERDILWRDTTTGQNYVWAMQNDTFLGDEQFAFAPSPWEIKQIGDWNGDGYTDIFWFQPETGQTAFWFMQKTTFLGWTPGPTFDPALWK